ncbi:MAG: TonB-dependent receptor [Pseudomonadales bacterium]|nr:TonB-dependent receptor [Pseudomonadales bacterium]
MAIEEIVVTAEKRETALMRTPLSVSAFSADTIVNRQLFDPRRLEQFVPSMTYQEAPAGVAINLRGIGTDNTGVGGDTGVSMYVDGIVLGHPFANASTLHDLERIEVLRGPQGTLYGRNSIGGSINFIRKLPEFDPSGSVSAIYGSESRSLVQLSGTTGLVDDLLAVRATYTYEERDGYRRNRATNGRVDDKEENSADIAFLLTPSENLEAVLRADWAQRDGSRSVSFVESIPGAPLNITQAFGARSCFDDSGCVYNAFDPEDMNRTWGVSGTLTWDIAQDLTLKSITSYRESKRRVRMDIDGTEIPFQLYRPGYTESADEMSQEFNLSGVAFDGNLDWITGLYFYDDDGDGVASFTLETITPLLAAAGALAPIPRISTGALAEHAFFEFTLAQEVRSLAAFGQATYHVNDRLRLTSGLRYTQDEKEAVQRHASNFQPTANCPGVEQDRTWSEVTGRGTLDFDLTETVMLYGTVSKGFKAGGFSVTECGGSYDPEILWAYEAGMKGQFLDGRLHVVAAGFYYDYSDIQVRKFVQNTAVILNAAEAEVYGLELEVRALFGGFELDGGLLAQHSEYIDFETLNATRGNVLQDVSGTQLQRAPDFKASLGLQYALEFQGRGSLTPRYEYSYTDQQHHDVFDDPWGRMDGFSLHNLRVDWLSADKRWRLSGFVDNLTDEDYVEFLNPVVAIGGSIAFWAPPRTWGGRLQYIMAR